jgi:hypothetical protein
MPEMYCKIVCDGEEGKDRAFFVRIYSAKPAEGDKPFDMYECFDIECDEETQKHLEWKTLDADPKFQTYLSEEEGKNFAKRETAKLQDALEDLQDGDGFNFSRYVEDTLVQLNKVHSSGGRK